MRIVCVSGKLANDSQRNVRIELTRKDIERLGVGRDREGRLLKIVGGLDVSVLRVDFHVFPCVVEVAPRG